MKDNIVSKNNHPKNSGKAPSFQFYYKDWLTDTRLIRVPKSTKGVWIDLICLSCDMPNRGVFSDENGSFSEQEIVQMLHGNFNCNLKDFRRLLSKNIIKQMNDKTFYVKRIKQDTELSDKRKAAGRLGGNPNLVGSLVNQPDNQKPTPSSSPSSSTSPSPSIVKEKIDKKEKFKPPTIEEVTAYFTEKNLHQVTPEYFFDFYESKNWMVGKNKMSNWKSAANRTKTWGKKTCDEDLIAGAIKIREERERRNAQTG